jgi:hypothetical protein
MFKGTLDAEAQPNSFRPAHEDQKYLGVEPGNKPMPGFAGCAWPSKSNRHRATSIVIVILLNTPRLRPIGIEGCETMRRRRKLLPPPETPSNRINQVCRRQINLL